MTETETSGGRAASVVSGVEIVLDAVTKHYPGQRDPAVDRVSLTIPAGEIVVLVGPSGCGKTTTMRMINRLIEPSSGTITIDGRDAATIQPDRLRRGIGYSIQQAGLFPHLTVAKNVATVPGLIGWNRRRVAERVDEMLELVGLDPGTFRDRYPRQLSGGQQQRVGVARALAADPPVLLMDEPFGAVDPITRGLLQDELLRLQGELGKTIVFVTHDFSEAVKLGDRIAVLGDRSRILQYDTPAAILADPADETVAGFVGADASLKQLTLTRVGDVDLGDCPTATEEDPVGELRAALADRDWPWALVLDAQGRPRRWVSADQLAHADSLRDLGTAVPQTLSLRSTLQDALEALLTHQSATAVVTGAHGEYAGLITIDTLVGHLSALRAEHGAGRAATDGAA
ncbi:ATP-binding cassette domain-containing protein [Nocardia sp. CDC186]|uniref:ATP-binding cassette domain-containing protein n=1 Tax=Nocardia implantans TaxID=3108168 RepID=A0ABU6B139_9NOCA|nr:MULTISPECIES: ATP-binding cassette domain-containing protein [unclassified Nocardia]MBF6195532.1 ATP-binding cassette domain-containing protein [Nocardia beijingensis]MEA3531958.1 ATP-binding cassette domain-containing protein [Nocardia sp. CDC192]MEB3513452.1 ATP-binding cassette domain-containing protein [Nocardia sp. CDC186]